MNNCQEMFKSIRFDVDLICSCCTNKRGAVVKIDKSMNISDIMQDYFTLVNQLQQNINISNKDSNLECLEAGCNNCYKLKEEFKSYDDLKINFINIANWRQCNLKCIYCCFKSEQKVNSTYDIYPYIKYLIDNKKLSDDLQVIIAGGEPGVLDNIDKILKLFSSIKNVRITILTNMVIFKKEYIPLLKNGNLFINTSIDCANKKLYEYIHKYNKFDLVIKNLKIAKKYAKDSMQVKIKYIFIENINDKKEYIDEFIKLAKRIGVGQVQYDFDRCEENINKIIPANILELYAYAKNASIVNGLFVDLDPRSESIYKQKRYIWSWYLFYNI